MRGEWVGSGTRVQEQTPRTLKPEQKLQKCAPLPLLPSHILGHRYVKTRVQWLLLLLHLGLRGVSVWGCTRLGYLMRVVGVFEADFPGTQVGNGRSRSASGFEFLRISNSLVFAGRLLEPALQKKCPPLLAAVLEREASIKSIGVTATFQS